MSLKYNSSLATCVAISTLIGLNVSLLPKIPLLNFPGKGSKTSLFY